MINYNTEVNKFNSFEFRDSIFDLGSSLVDWEIFKEQQKLNWSISTMKKKSSFLFGRKKFSSFRKPVS